MLINILRPASSSLLRTFQFRFGVIKFNLPDLGEKIKEGTIKKLYVSEGDAVSEFQKIADVASDKQFTEITATDSGIIKKIHYKEEDVCQVGDLFLEIEVEGGKPTQTNDVPQVETQKVVQPTETKKATNTGVSSGVLATPYVRGLAK